MANTVIQLRNSTVTGNIPSTLANGEISINSRDGKFFYSTPAGVIVTHYPFTGPAGLNKEVQFNDSGTLGSSSGFTFDKASGLLSSTLLRSAQSSGDEGGQIDLATAATNQSLSGGYVNIDIFQNKLRIFESGGTNRGVFIDMANGATAGVGTNLLSPSSATDSVARNTANAAFLQANTPSYTANSAASYANSAFAAANAATASDTTQNSNISSAATYANAAFAAANAATATDTTQNNSITSAFATANSAASYANSAFAAANAANFTDTTQNNSITAAFATANSAASYANSAFAAANTANATDTTQNNSITAAFTTANSAGVYANGAFTKANSAASIADILALSIALG